MLVVDMKKVSFGINSLRCLIERRVSLLCISRGKQYQIQPIIIIYVLASLKAVGAFVYKKLDDGVCH